MTFGLFLIQLFATFTDWIGIRYDDAYITFRYAANSALGNGLRFNIDSNVNSASAFLFTLLLSLWAQVDIATIPRTADILNLAGMCTIFVSLLLWVRLLHRNKSYFLIIYAFAAIPIFSGFLSYWALSGMETVFSCGVLAGSISAAGYAHQTNNQKGAVVVALTNSLLALCRPEFAFVALSISVWWYICISRRNRAWSISPASKATLPLYSVVITVSLQLGFYKIYYHSFVPDPVRFKSIVNYYHLSFGERLSELVTFVRGNFASLLFSIAILAVISLRRSWKSIDFDLLILPIVVIAAYLVPILFSPHADWNRYDIPLIVPLCFLIGSLGQFKSRFELALILSILVFFAFQTNHTNQASLRFLKEIAVNDAPIQAGRIDVGKFLESKFATNDWVWSSDLGAISFYNIGNRFFDASGLTNRELLDSFKIKSDYSDLLCSVEPTYLADSVALPADIPGAVWLLDNLDSYYIQESPAISTSRKSSDLIELRRILLTNENSHIGIGVYEVNWIGCEG